jgi:putative glycosyltransferase
MELSVVTTLYKSEIYLDRFLERITKAIEKINITHYEIVFVNDGSPDNSFDKVLSLKLQYPEIVLIDLSRNFGHHNAIQAGLRYTSGEYIFLIDNDLETPPELLVDAYIQLTSDKSFDFVYGFQENRKGGIVEKIGGDIFYDTFNKLSDTSLPKNILTECLFTRKYLNSFLLLGDSNLFIAGMMSWTGFKQKGIPVIKNQRDEASTYSTRRRLQLLINAVASFTGKPLEYLFYFGLGVSFLSFLTIVYLVSKKVILGTNQQIGWTSLIAMNFLLMGVISTFLGVIGIYINKIFKQVQNRPNYIIKNIYD